MADLLNAAETELSFKRIRKDTNLSLEMHYSVVKILATSLC